MSESFCSFKNKNSDSKGSTETSLGWYGRWIELISEGFSGEPNLLPVNSFNERLLNFIKRQGLLTWALPNLSIYFKNFPLTQALSIA